MTRDRTSASRDVAGTTQGTDETEDGKTAAVEFEGVAHFFDGIPAVMDISLRVPHHEFCSIVGPSGCGKTTCLNIVAGDIRPRTGTVNVLGQSPALGDLRIGYMFARDALFPWRTATDNVAIGLEARRVPKKERREKARELLDAVGLGHAFDSYPSQLSQGMRQRVALARTFALGAELLLMDEPFAALDAQTRILLEEHVTQLWERDRSTVLFVTHDLAEAIVLSDRIILMSASPGQIKRVYDVPLPRPRSAKQLQGDPRFHQLYEEIWEDLSDEVVGSDQ